MRQPHPEAGSGDPNFNLTSRQLHSCQVLPVGDVPALSRLDGAKPQVFTREIEHTFECLVGQVALEVLLWLLRWTRGCSDKAVLNS